MCVLFFWGWRVGGWGNNVLFDYYYMVRSLALPHIRHARLLEFLLHFHTYVMLRCWTFSCTRTTLCLKQKTTVPRSFRDTQLQLRCGKTHSFPILRRTFHGIVTTNVLKKNKLLQFRTFPPSSCDDVC